MSTPLSPSSINLGLVTTRSGIVPKDDYDVEHFMAAAASLGATITMLPWGQPVDRWAAFDLIAFRSPWDYPLHVADFSQWLASVRGLANLHNPPALVEWNLDKRYMADLAQLGVAVVPSVFASDPDAVTAAFANPILAASEHVVVKPTVSAGSKNTGLFRRGDPAARALADEILSLGKTVMVQPAIASVAAVGETAMLYFDGRFSHSVTKGPLLAEGGGLRSGDTYEEDIQPVVPTEEQRACADAAVAAIESMGIERGWLAPGERLLYGRIDIVQTETGPAVLEAELFEPSLFLWTSDGAGSRYISALINRANNVKAT